MGKPLIERVVSIVVLPEGDPLFSEMATRVDIVDEAGGEFVKVKQNLGRTDGDGAIFVSPEEWPALRQAIDRMVVECKEEHEHT